MRKNIAFTIYILTYNGNTLPSKIDIHSFHAFALFYFIIFLRFKLLDWEKKWWQGKNKYPIKYKFHLRLNLKLFESISYNCVIAIFVRLREKIRHNTWSRLRVGVGRGRGCPAGSLPLIWFRFDLRIRSDPWRP